EGGCKVRRREHPVPGRSQLDQRHHDRRERGERAEHAGAQAGASPDGHPAPQGGDGHPEQQTARDVDEQRAERKLAVLVRNQQVDREADAGAQHSSDGHSDDVTPAERRANLHAGDTSAYIDQPTTTRTASTALSRNSSDPIEPLLASTENSTSASS